jgi:hypothetical protein
MFMRAYPKATLLCCRNRLSAFLPQFTLIAFLAIATMSAAAPKQESESATRLSVQMDAPATDVLKAVQEVTQDQIVHGTYSYDKERILYGAHGASSAPVFGPWKGAGTAFYKVATGVLSPRNFKDSEDIGTISVRYVVQGGEDNKTVVQIDAVFVDARNVKHPSLGNVESSEYSAVQQHLKKIQAKENQPQQPASNVAEQASTAPADQSSVSSELTNAPPPAAAATVPELQKEIESLRHEVELRVRYQGAQLKSAPFHSSATLESLPPETEVLIVVLTPYWYGVETTDGHHGWVHHSQLEPLP